MILEYKYSIIVALGVIALDAALIILNFESIYTQQNTQSEPNPPLNAIPPLSLNLTDEDVEVPDDRSLNNMSTLEGIEKSQLGDVIPGEQGMKFEGQQLQQLNQTNP